jgi:hypothetical protein
MKTYEVAFVIYGYITHEDDDIGPTECNGFTKQNNEFYLKDGRIYYNITAETPEKAYEFGKQIFAADDFKDLTITDWTLEHISYNDTYWYKEDLKF